MPVPLAALAGGCANLIGKIVTRCEEVTVFGQRLTYVASHLQTVSDLLQKKIQDQQADNAELSNLLVQYTQELEKLLEKVEECSQRSFVAKMVFKSMEVELDELLKSLSSLESSMNVCLNIVLSSNLENVGRELEEAKGRDRQDSKMLEDLNAKLDKLHHSQNEQKHDRLMGFFNSTYEDIDKEGNKSPWLQSAATFRGLIAELRHRAERDLLEQFDINNDASMDRISIIQGQALDALNELETHLRQLPMELKRKEAFQNLSNNLQDQKRRIKDLCLRVSFIGPAKSGKSTSINAIVGAGLFPSGITPMTVMPTTIRHTPGQAKPCLYLDTDVVTVMEKISVTFSENRDTILDKCGCNSAEQNTLWRCPYTFVQEKEFDDLAELQTELAVMNHFCRIWALARQEEILNDGENPLISIIRGQRWPVVKLELQLLKGVNMVGSFELVDTPGRDETHLIPEIKAAVNEATQRSAAVVCVISALASGTDSVKTVQQELKAALRHDLPVYLLANRVDGLPAGENIPNFEVMLGRKFLEGKYDASSQSVFGVSAIKALNHGTLSRLHDHPHFKKTLKMLPDLVNESGQLVAEFKSPVDDASTKALLAFVMETEGATKWRKRAPRLSDEDIEESLEDLYQGSRFDAFNNKLMKELAPVSGMKVLETELMLVESNVKDINNNIDMHVNMMLADTSAYAIKKESVERQLQALKKTLENDIPLICDKFETQMKTQLGEELRRIEVDVTKHVKEQMIEISKPGSGFQYKLNEPPNDEKMKVAPHLKNVQGKRYWEVPITEQHEFQRDLSKILHEKVETDLDGLVVSFETKQKKLRDDFMCEIIKTVSTEIESAELSVETDHVQRLKMERFKLPDEDLGKTVQIQETKSKWWTLYLVQSVRNVGTSCLIEFDEAVKSMQDALGKKMVQMSGETLGDQCKKQFSQIGGILKAAYQNRIKEVEKDMKGIDVNRSNMKQMEDQVLSMAKARIMNAACYTEVLALRRLAQPGEAFLKLQVRKPLGGRRQGGNSGAGDGSNDPEGAEEDGFNGPEGAEEGPTLEGPEGSRTKCDTCSCSVS